MADVLSYNKKRAESLKQKKKKMQHFITMLVNAWKCKQGDEIPSRKNSCPLTKSRYIAYDGSDTPLLEI